MKQPIKEKIFQGLKIIVAIILALAMIASVAATITRGAEVQDTVMAEKGDA